MKQCWILYEQKKKKIPPKNIEKKKIEKFGLFLSFEHISKQTDLFRNKPKQPKNFWKIPKYALYQTVSVGLLFVLVKSKHRNSLFRYRSETNVLCRKTSFGSSFSCFESKLVSKDTLPASLAKSCPGYANRYWGRGTLARPSCRSPSLCHRAERTGGRSCQVARPQAGCRCDRGRSPRLRGQTVWSPRGHQKSCRPGCADCRALAAHPGIRVRRSRRSL